MITFEVLKMHYRPLFILALFFIGFTATAQRLDYGLGVNFNAPLVKNKTTNFSANPGYGLGFNFTYRMPQDYALSARMQLNRTIYYSPTLVANVNVDQFQFYLGASKAIKSMDSTAFFFHLLPSYANVVALSQKNLGNTGSPKIYLNENLSNTLDLGIQLGTEIKLSKYTGLEFSYIYYLNATPKIDYYDAQPHVVRLALNLHFRSEKQAVSANQEMRIQLRALQSDTLIVVNKACSRIMSDSMLRALFTMNYSFSAFKVINSDQLEEIKQHSSPLFYAIVGELYGGMGEPQSAGIFLLDSAFELTAFPYPVHTTYVDQLSNRPCFDSIENTKQSIKNFNRRLYNSK